MFLSDQQIKKREGMIEPFLSNQVKEIAGPDFQAGQKAISYGLSSYGYDARLDNTFLIPRFDPTANMVIDPKNTYVTDYDQYTCDRIVIPPHSFILGQTLEYFKIPRDILALCIGKSTYARCGIIVNVTPLEPEWEGHVTIEISNTNVKPALIYAGEGIAQFLFAWNGGKVNECETSYKDRAGKYQGQIGVTLPKV